MNSHCWTAIILLSILLALAGGNAPAADQLSAPDDSAQKAAARIDVPPTAKNPRIKSIKVLQPVGARGRFAPTNDYLVFDRKNADGYFDVYLSDLNGKIIRSLTEGKPGIGQRNNGNAVFHPSGKYIVFISEVADHYGGKAMSEPGIGLFNNLWATDVSAGHFWQLTQVPIKKSLFDKTPAFATVNPVFSPDGGVLIWTERYDQGGHHNWGRWRIKGANFVVIDGIPQLQNERVIFTPRRGNYVTAMGFFDNTHLLVAGNLDGQHEYAMDEYLLDIRSGRFENLTNTDNAWEEGAAIAPNGQVVFMSSRDSDEKIDMDNSQWWKQKIYKEWYLMNRDGTGVERLSYFNDPGAPEYSNRKVWAVNMNISRDGRYMAGTVAVAAKEGPRTGPQSLALILVEFVSPLR
jgi:Tol biopolymer transport system component